MRLEWKFLFIAYKSSFWYLIICPKYLNIFEALLSYQFWTWLCPTSWCYDTNTQPYIFILAFTFSCLKTHVVLSEDHTQGYCIAESRKENEEQRSEKGKQRVIICVRMLIKFRNARAFRCNKKDLESTAVRTVSRAVSATPLKVWRTWWTLLVVTKLKTRT